MKRVKQKLFKKLFVGHLLKHLERKKSAYFLESEVYTGVDDQISNKGFCFFGLWSNCAKISC